MVNSCAMERLEDLRRLERLPESSPGYLMPGVVALTAWVVQHERLVPSPETNTPSVWYRRTVEREERDSEGNTRWVTIPSRTRVSSAPFLLADSTGETLVDLSAGAPEITGEMRYRQRRGNLRFTEYRIEPQDILFVVGVADSDPWGKSSIHFQSDGPYPMIATVRGSEGYRSGVGMAAILLSALGLALLTLAVTFFFGLFRLHDTTLYIFGIGAIMIGALTWLSLQMLERDLEAAYASALSVTVNAATQWATAERAPPAQDPEAALERLSGAIPQGLDADVTERLQRFRIDAVRRIRRTNAQRASMPERFLAPIWGIPAVPEPPLAETEEAILAELESDFFATQLRAWWTWLLLAFAVAGAWALGKLGIRSTKHKRIIENLPTTPLRGATVGLNELTERAVPLSDEHIRPGPVSGAPCLWYEYRITETRGSGKNSRTVTILHEFWDPAFILRDGQQNTLLVLSEGAEIIAGFTNIRRQGRRTYHEKRIEPGSELYVLGTAEVDPHFHDRLRVVQGDPEDPFIISAIPEDELLYRKGRIAQWLLNFGVNLMVFAGFLLFGLSGGFSPLDYNLTATMATLWLLAILGVLMYNDLVFLRRRADRNLSNIDVALKKRHDLVRNLVSTVQSFAAHEQEVLHRVAELRNRGEVKRGDEQAQEASPMQIQAVGNSFLGLREAYPELGSHELFATLSDALVDLEDDIALMRGGYNDSVERLNARIQRIPECFIASRFGFKARPYLEMEPDIVEPPTPTFERRARQATGAYAAPVRPTARIQSDELAEEARRQGIDPATGRPLGSDMPSSTASPSDAPAAGPQQGAPSSTPVVAPPAAVQPASTPPDPPAPDPPTPDAPTPDAPPPGVFSPPRKR